MNKNILFLFIILIIVFVVIIINKKIDATKGGVLYGDSHEDGGIKAKIIGIKREIEVEGGEDVLTKKVNLMKENYSCTGTPEGIASAINVLGGGISFSNEGNCYKIK